MMDKKKILALFSLMIILAFMGYIVYDTIKGERKPIKTIVKDNDSIPDDKWYIAEAIYISEGLKAVAITPEGDILTGGESFIARHDSQFNEVWHIEMPEKITALAVSSDTLFACSEELIYLVNSNGEIISEWGPYDAGCIITSVSANKKYVAIADAGNKIVFIIKKDGEVHSMIGHFGERLLIPSPYFDVKLTEDDILFMAQTGRFRIEKRNINGELLSTFGQPGGSPEDFCGCCNPAHFTIIPQGFVTAEKGINRIKIMGHEGGFVEFVSAVNDFIASSPLDVASADGKIIYGANPADSKLYVFERK